jgi:flagellin-like hook-associated protein FlgL
MAVNDIGLTSGMRSNLVSLQNTVSLLDRTQTRLASGKKVNSAIDNPLNYFAAQNHLNRANDLDARKDAISEAIQTVKAADSGIKGIQGLIESARGLAQSALSSQDATTRATLATQFDTIRAQIDALSGDSGYKGTNLVAGDNLSVKFNEDGSSSLDITGFTATSAALTIDAAAGSWATDTNINDALTDLDGALTALRTQSQTLASNLNVINIRAEFTSTMIDALVEGADNLTAADMNEEGANMLMLQTRQTLSTTALSLSAQAAQSVLRLF